MILDFFDGFKVIPSQPFCPDCSVVALDVGVLLRLARLDVFKPDVAFLGPCYERSTDVFWAVVDANCLRLRTTNISARKVNRSSSSAAIILIQTVNPQAEASPNTRP